MNGLETAIRNALARAGTPDAEARARIYQSARMAVEKSLDKQGTADEAARLEQRERLEAVIAAIEGEFEMPAETTVSPVSVAAPAGPEFHREPVASRDRLHDDFAVGSPRPDPAVAPAPAVAADPASAVGDGRFAPTVAVDAPTRAVHAGEEIDGEPRSRLEARADDRLSAPERPAAAVPAEAGRSTRRGWFGRRKPGGEARTPAPAVEKPRRRKRRGGALVSLFVQLLVLAGLIGGVLWWISANGGLEQAGRRLADAGVGMMGPPPEGSAAPLNRVGAGQFEGDWVTLFEPSDAGRLDVGGSAVAELEEGGLDPAVSITSVSAGADGEVSVPLDADALTPFAGTRALVALTLRAGDGPTQIYVRCALAGADDCGRRRFDVNHETSDLLFDIDVPGGIPADGGRLIINSDVAGEGRGIDLFSVRLQPAT